MALPTISIITVVRNAPAALNKTLLNLTSIKYPAIELIVVDGASTDNTLEVARNFGSKITTLISEPDSGLYDAMNKGIKLAKGDFLWFINAGDSVSISGDELCRTFENAETLDVVYGQTMIVDAEGRALGLRSKKLPEKLTWRSLKHGMVVCHQSFIVRRSIAPLYDLRWKYSADVEWVIKCLQNCRPNSIYNVSPAILSEFELGGMTTQHHKASLWERWHIMRKYYGLCTTLWAHFVFSMSLVMTVLFCKKGPKNF